jgi:uncharacterized protein (DUF885 family)
MTAAEVLDALAEEFADLRTELQPLLGLLLGGGGDPRALQDVSEAGEAAARQRLQDLRDRVAAVAVDGLDPTRATSRLMLLDELDGQLATIDLRTVEMTVDAFLGGPQAVLLATLPKTRLTGKEDAEDLTARFHAVPKLLQDSLDRLRHGAAHGRTATEFGARAAVAQCRDLAGRGADSPLLLPFRAAVDALPAGTLESAAAVLEEVVAPALRAFADGVEQHVLPAARPDDRVGLAHLEDGATLYAQALRQFTTTELGPEEIHQIGRDVIAGLEGEYAELGAKVFGTSDVQVVFSRLRDDPELRFASGEDARRHAEDCIRRAASVVGDWIGRNPVKPCAVEAMPAAAAAGMTVAYYQPPAGPDAPHGTYWINTTGPIPSRYESEVVAFHEAVPGHHTQIALQAELDLPRFRQAGLLLAGYQEGWGLYTERLCEEMGLYSDDLSRLGMLAMDSLRACRLVVDTGLHHLGWSRQQALDYLLANAPVTADFAVAEVNRYCVYPGQACAYMIGRHEIARLRRLAEQALGERFDIRAFHDVVLGQGSVPLNVLAANVTSWLERGAAVPTPS